MKPGCGNCKRLGRGCFHHPDEPPALTATAGPDGKELAPEWTPWEGRCNAKRFGGTGLCRLKAGWGTEHVGVGCCKRHGGKTPTHNVGAQRELARRAVVTYGLPVEIDPQDALLQEVWRTYGHVLWLSDWIQQYDPESLVFGVVSEDSAKVRRGGAGKDSNGDEWRLHGLRKFTARAAPSVWLQEYQRERQHLARVCRDAIACGLAERQVKLAEEQGRQIAGVIQVFISSLEAAGKLNAGDPEVPPMARKALMAVQREGEAA